MVADEQAKAERRARRVARRREEILAAAMRLFQTIGFKDTTIRLIAEEADVSESTFTNYFTDKGELLLEALRSSSLALLIEQLERRDAPFETVLADIGRWRATHGPASALQAELWAEIIARPELRERYNELIWRPAAAALESALGRRQSDGGKLMFPPVLMARVIMACLLGLSLMSLVDPQIGEMLADGGREAEDVQRFWLKLIDA